MVQHRNYGIGVEKYRFVGQSPRGLRPAGMGA